MTLPSFIVIGAMKAGTVSLRHHLDDHPGVFRGRSGGRAEPNFFIVERNWTRGLDWYQSLFEGGRDAAAVGECSPSYTMADTYRGVPARMASVVPNARLVYLVREPVARMESMYIHLVASGRERRAAEVALLEDRYLGPSLYGRQLDAFLEHFDRSQVLIVASEELRDRPRTVLTEVFVHIGVDPDAVDLDRRYRDHRSAGKRVPRLHGVDWLPRRHFQPRPRWRPDERSGLLRVLTTRRLEAGDCAISDGVRRRIAERSADDLVRLEELWGRPLPDEWA